MPAAANCWQVIDAGSNLVVVCGTVAVAVADTVFAPLVALTVAVFTTAPVKSALRSPACVV